MTDSIDTTPGLNGFITTKQAAKLSGYTKDYVGQLARAGHLTSKKEGRERLVKVVDLFEYIAQKEALKQTPVAEVVTEKKVEVQTSADTVLESTDDNTDQTVTKKIISPWVTATNPIAAPETVSIKPEFSVKSYESSEKPSRRLPVVKPEPMSLLPMITAGSVAMAAMVFMFSFGTLATDLASHTDNQVMSASVGSLNLLDNLAYGWYEFTSQFLK